MSFGSDICSFLIIVFVVISLAWLIYVFVIRPQRIKEAGERYRLSLGKLRNSPSNMDLRQKTLDLGREYARLARAGGKETIFDEVALMNDLNAVGVATTQVPTPAENEVAAEKSIESRLRALDDLKAKGLITDDEYQERRKEILGSV